MVRVGGTELAAGEYKVQAGNDKVTFIQGKPSVVSAPAKLETAATDEPNQPCSGDAL
jgi:hypothetical protein